MLSCFVKGSPGTAIVVGSDGYIPESDHYLRARVLEQWNLLTSSISLKHQIGLRHAIYWLRGIVDLSAALRSLPERLSLFAEERPIKKLFYVLITEHIINLELTAPGCARCYISHKQEMALKRTR